MRSIVVLLLFTALALASWEIPTQNINVNTTTTDTLPPCSMKEYVEQSVNGGPGTFLVLEYEHSLGPAVDISLYYGTYEDGTLIGFDTCSSDCEIELYCGFTSGIYTVVISTLGVTDSVTFDITLMQYGVPVRQIDLGTKYTDQQPASPTTNDGDGIPTDYTHYSFSVPSNYPIDSKLVVEVSDLQGESYEVFINKFTIADSYSGCYIDSDTDTVEAEVQVTKCVLEPGVYYVSLDTAASPTTNTFSIYPYLVSPNVVDAHDGFQHSSHLYDDDVVNYDFDYSGTSETDVLEIRVHGVVGGTVGLSVVAPNDPEHLAGITNEPSCLALYDTCTNIADTCVIVVDTCFFSQGTWYIAVEEESISGSTVDYVQYGIDFNVIEQPLTTVALVDGYYSDSNVIGKKQYHQYAVSTTGIAFDSVLTVSLFVNHDQFAAALYENEGSRASKNPTLEGVPEITACYENERYCMTQNWTPISNNGSCEISLQKCELLENTIYYFAVYGSPDSNYDVDVEYSIVITLTNAVEIFNERNINDAVVLDHYNHYYINVGDGVYQAGQSLNVKIFDVENGEVHGYVYYNDLAGECPCYKYQYDCITSDECLIEVPYCEFSSGVWYVGIFGDDQTGMDSDRPIKFTLTAFLVEAPEVGVIEMNSYVNNQVNEANYVHYKFSTTSMTNMEALSMKVIITDPEVTGVERVVTMFVNKNQVADSNCNDYYCTTTSGAVTPGSVDQSYCSIALQPCDVMKGTYYISVRDDVDLPEEQWTHFTVYVSAWDTTATQVTAGSQGVVGHVLENQYQHYVWTSPSTLTGVEHAIFELYPNKDHDEVEFFVNAGGYAGYDYNVHYDLSFEIRDCYDYEYYCETSDIETVCRYIVPPCKLQANTQYYMSVYGVDHQFASNELDYSVKVIYKSLTTLDTTGFGIPVTGAVYEGDYDIYRYTIDTVPEDSFFTLELQNVQFGSVIAYWKYQGVGGVCNPCFSEPDAVYSANDGEFRTRFYTCDLEAGDYYVTVLGADTTDLSKPASYTIKGFYTATEIDTSVSWGSYNATIDNDVWYSVEMHFPNGAGATDYWDINIFDVDFSGSASGSVDVFVNKGVIGSPSCSIASCTVDSSTDCWLRINPCDFMGGSETFYVTYHSTISDDDETVFFDVNQGLGSPLEFASGADFDTETRYGTTAFYEVSDSLDTSETDVVLIEISGISCSSATMYVYPATNPMAGPFDCNGCSYMCTDSSSCEIEIDGCAISGNSNSFTIAVEVGGSGDTNCSYTLNASSLDATDDSPDEIIINTLTTVNVAAGGFSRASISVDPSDFNDNSYMEITIAPDSNLDIYVSSTEDYPMASCNEFACIGSSDCTLDIEPCCFIAQDYNFLIYNNGGSGSSVDFTFDVIEGNDDGSIDWDDDNTITTLQPGVTFFDTTVDTSDFSSTNFDITGNNVHVYINSGLKAYLPSESICYNYEWDDAAPILEQFAFCEFTDGEELWFGIDNTGSGASSADINIETVNTIRLDEEDWETDVAIDNNGFYQQFYFNHDCGSLSPGAEIIIEVDNANVNGDMYLRYGLPAGDNADSYCYDQTDLPDGTNGHSSISGSTGTIRGSACGLASGTWFVGVSSSSNSMTFDIRFRYVDVFVQTVPEETDTTPDVSQGDDEQYYLIQSGNGGATSYLVVDVKNSDGNYDVFLWGAGGCQPAVATGSVTTSDDLQITFDPCHFDGGNFYLLVEGSGSDPVYEVYWEIRDMVVNTLAVEDTAYAIMDDTDVYVTYSINTGDYVLGDASLSISYYSECGELDVYVLKGSHATPNCYDDSSLRTAGATFSYDSCEFTGGIYYVTVVIREENRNADFPFDDDNVGIRYSISSHVTSANVTQIAMWNEEIVDNSYDIQFLYHADAENVGTQYYFRATTSGTGVDIYIRDDHPFCAPGFATTDSAVVHTTCASNDCTFEMHPSIFENSQYWIYVVFSGSNLGTLEVTNDDKRVPVVTKANSPITFQHSVCAGQYQHYKVVVDPELYNMHLTVILTNVDTTYSAAPAATISLIIRDDIVGDEEAVVSDPLYTSEYGPIMPAGSTGAIERTGCNSDGVFFISVYGETDDRIDYPNEVQNAEVDYHLYIQLTDPVDNIQSCVPVCDSAEGDEYHHYHLLGQTSLLNDQSYITVTISEITPVSGAADPFTATLRAYNNQIAVSPCDIGQCTATEVGNSCTFTLYCNLEDIYVSVLSDVDITYQITVCHDDKEPVAITSLPYSGVATGPTYYSYNGGSTTWNAYMTAVENSCGIIVNSDIYAKQGQIPDTSSCYDYYGSDITNWCMTDSDTWFFYVPGPGTFNLVNSSPQVTTLPAMDESIENGEWNHYSFNVGSSDIFSTLTFTLNGVEGADLTAYISYGHVSANDFCQDYSFTTSDGFGSLTVPTCNIIPGTWYMSVFVSNMLCGASDINYDASASVATLYDFDTLTAGTARDDSFTGTLCSVPGSIYYLVTMNLNEVTFPFFEIYDITGGSITATVSVPTNPDNGSGACVLTTLVAGINSPKPDDYDYFPCQFTGSHTFMIEVSSDLAAYSDGAVDFTIRATAQTFASLPSGTVSLDRDTELFYTATTSQQSLVVHVGITAGPTLEVEISESPCFDTRYTHLFECSESQCELQLPTLASLYTAAASTYTYYIRVVGSNGNVFSVSSTTGTGNCVAGQTGLTPDNFCYDVVTYQRWGYVDSLIKDREAEAFYNWLVYEFYCANTETCHYRLKIYACHKFFKSCDAAGFWEPLDTNYCTDVATVCNDWWKTMDNIVCYECSNERYGSDDLPEPSSNPWNPTSDSDVSLPSGVLPSGSYSLISQDSNTTMPSSSHNGTASGSQLLSSYSSGADSLVLNYILVVVLAIVAVFV